ncbi:MAG: hypothetical protein O7C63_03855 [Alphaproteobacteria bacterium]|nr:hypothetical protein [Alphaproteobacteria bacterium]
MVSPGEISTHIRLRFSQVRDALASLAEADLLDDGNPPRPPAGPERPDRVVVPPPDLDARLGETAATSHLRLMGHDLRLDFSTEALAKSLAPIIASLAERWPSSPTSAHGPARELALIEDDEGIVYGCDQGQAVYSSTNERSAAAVLERLLFRGALYETDCVLTLHCGSVGIGGRDGAGHPAAWLALPAAPRSGKTTLTAALAHAGFECGGDELLALRDDFAARPMDYPLCIKEKSWPVLAGRFPELADLPIYQRKAFLVRYLSPRPSAAQTDWRPIAAFVFPRYVEDTKTDLSPLDPLAGMQRLFSQCMSVPQPLTLEDVGGIVEFCARTPSYELELSDLSAAVDAVRKLAATL